MPIISRALTRTILPPGIYPYFDAVGLTNETAVVAGDIIADADTKYFRVEGVKPHKVGDKTAFYECQLSHQRVYAFGPASATWSKTRPQPPQRRMKTYIDTYARAAQITKDDDSTAATFAMIWENPPYPLYQEFRATANAVFGLYVVGEPNTTPLPGMLQTPYGFKEEVPVHVCTVNTVDYAGATLQWKMEAELRYVVQQNPGGSLLTLNRRASHDRMVGSVWMYDNEWVITYKRDLTT